MAEREVNNLIDKNDQTNKAFFINLENIGFPRLSIITDTHLVLINIV